MPDSNYFALGDWNAACFECGRKFKASQLRKHWKGYYVCENHFEPRHPQDFVRGVPDIQTVPWSQPQTDTLTYVCSFNGLSAIPGYSIPGCMIPGRTTIDGSDVNFDLLPVCTLYGKSAVPWWAMPGCSVPGNPLIYDENVNGTGEWTADRSDVTADSTFYTADG